MAYFALTLKGTLNQGSIDEFNRKYTKYFYRKQLSKLSNSRLPIEFTRTDFEIEPDSKGRNHLHGIIKVYYNKEGKVRTPYLKKVLDSGLHINLRKLPTTEDILYWFIYMKKNDSNAIKKILAYLNRFID